MYRIIDKISNTDIRVTNEYLESLCGVVNFFSTEEERYAFISKLESEGSVLAEDKVCYGDWQTPQNLADSICASHKNLLGEPDILIEPTCGKGAFILSALNCFRTLSEIHAIEINSEYTLELKLRILSYALSKTEKTVTKIFIYTADFFRFDFQSIFDKARVNNLKIAIIGNPPWVTNSVQGVHNSSNIPCKSNAYQLKGIDAITGKSNFDISESIVLSLLSLADKCKGGISILLKNSVIHNILLKQRQYPKNIWSIKQNRIDASKEFNVSVEASCLMAKFGKTPAETCDVIDFYTQSYISSFGWMDSAFVSNLANYESCKSVDGVCPYIWRSGVKHDCSEILELTLTDGSLYNKLGEMVDIEPDLIYPFAKSSDIANFGRDGIRKYILIPQRYVGEDISFIRNNLPKTYDYLLRHQDYFSKRKSSIYKGKGPFSIFGIGDYSFMPYKIAISALYKNIRFALISPVHSKPVLLDDTCYQIGFQNFEEAKIALEALQSDKILSLIQALSFSDAKRVITKSLLMRLDISSMIQPYQNNKKRRTPVQLSLFE